MKVGVTGGAGYIGSTLVKELLSRKHEVVSVDNETIGSYEYLIENEIATEDHLIKEDIRNADLLEKHWKDCELCHQKKSEVITLHCSKSDDVVYNQVNRKKFVNHNICKCCAGKWNIRDKGCAFCRQDHSWDKEALKHFKFVRRISTGLPFFFQDIERIAGNEFALFLISDLMTG